MANVYTRTAPPQGQLLQVTFNGKQYQFSTMHSEYGMRRVFERSQKEHAHALYHIVLFAKGTNRVQFKGRHVDVRRGSLIISSPDQPHDFSPSMPGDIVYHEITFELTHTTPLRLPFHELLSLYTGQTLHAREMPHTLKPSDTNLLEEKFEILMTRLERNDVFAAHTHLVELFGFLIDRVFAITPSMLDPMETTLKMLESRYAEPLTLQELAEHVKLSPSYLCRAFKKRFGWSPMDYQCELRIRAAKNLLIHTHFSCKEIASRVGFCDVYTFSKTFRRKTKCSPSQLRKKHHSEK
jgi:AraC-like DNA-binding protein/mannose-6-phosphate isomerase-like protein (cupin superfamily)